MAFSNRGNFSDVEGVRTDFANRAADMMAVDRLDPSVRRLLDTAPVKILAESVLAVQQLYGVAARRERRFST